MPDVFRQVPGSILGTLLLFLLFAAPAPVSGQPKAIDAESRNTEMLDLPAALAQALLHNPELTVHSEEIRAREAEQRQSGFRPNPVLSIEAENVFGSGDFSGTDAAETTISLSQSIELGNKRARRRELAVAETAVAGSDYAQAKVDVLAKTEASFIAVLAAQERLKLAEELAALANKVLVTVDERIAAGKAPTTEAVKARIQLRELEIVREKARRNLAAARVSLATRMGSEAADFGQAFGELSRLPDLPEPAVLARAVADSPAILRRIKETERHRRAVALERTRRLPDVEVGLGVRHLQENDDTAMVLGVSIPLPVFDRNQGGVAAARRRLALSRAEERSTLLQAKADLGRIWQEMAAAHEEAKVLEKDILPDARIALETAEYGYRAGKFGILDVLDAQRTLVEAKERYLDALTACHQASIGLNRLLGRGLSEIWPPATVSAKE